MNKVSCITITKNRVNFLKRSLEHYLNQTYTDKEWIIVSFEDDVDTYNWIHGLSKEEIDLEENNIKFFQINSDILLGEARNIAIQKATGDWICIWDDDDYFAPTRIEEQLKFCKDNRVDGTLLSCLLLFSEKHQEIRVTFERVNGWEGTLLVKKENIQKYENLERGEDTPMIENLFQTANIKVMFNPDLYVYYLHSSNTSNSRHIQSIYDYSLPLSNEKNREMKKTIGLL